MKLFRNLSAVGIAAATVFAISLGVGSITTATAVSSSAQIFSTSATGGCSATYKTKLLYTYEEGYDSGCYFTIKVSQPSKIRTVEIQYYGNGKWNKEGSVKTNKSTGKAILIPDTEGSTGHYDGVWVYRFYSPKSGSLREWSSSTFPIVFVKDQSSSDPDYDENGCWIANGEYWDENLQECTY